MMKVTEFNTVLEERVLLCERQFSNSSVVGQRVLGKNANNRWREV
jgi:hypothetical protein